MNIIQTIKNNDILKIVLVIIVIYLFMTYYYKEHLDNTVPIVTNISTHVSSPSSTLIDNAPVLLDTDQQNQINKIIAGPTQLTTKDLLPINSESSDFAKQNPVSNLLKQQNFLQSGFHAGINTVLQSNKIPYNDIRSCPPIPKQDVGPWQQSSFEQPTGFGRRMLEIGS